MACMLCLHVGRNASPVHTLNFCPAAVERFFLHGISNRIRNSIVGHHWPQMSFSACEVIVGSATRINLVPHLGEFDEAGLFGKQLGYEDASFKWLDANASDSYDLIIEIGANVGVFTVFFDALARRGSRLRRSHCF